MQAIAGCKWSVIAPDNYYVRVIFNGFESNDGQTTTCPDSHLQFFDGVVESQDSPPTDVVDLGKYYNLFD